MKLRVFTLRLDPVSGHFDDESLVSFFAEHDALAVSEHFFVHEDVPTLAVLVRYREPGPPAAPVGRAGARREVEVPEADRALFEALRKWRNDRARRDGRPAYVLFTNAQLAAIAELRPRTLAALQTVDGIGEARARDHGEELLALVGSVPGSLSERVAADDDRHP